MAANGVLEITLLLLPRQERIDGQRHVLCHLQRLAEMNIAKFVRTVDELRVVGFGQANCRKGRKFA